MKKAIVGLKSVLDRDCSENERESVIEALQQLAAAGDEDARAILAGLEVQIMDKPPVKPPVYLSSDDDEPIPAYAGVICWTCGGLPYFPAGCPKCGRGTDIARS